MIRLLELLTYLLLVGSIGLVCGARSLEHEVYKHLSWDDLPREAKVAARILGYNENRWDNDRCVWSDDAWWNELNQQQQEAAQVLGWMQQTWDSDSSGCGNNNVGRESPSPPVSAPPPSEIDIPRGNTICQSSRNSMPHMAGRWRNGFPVSSRPTALCNGRIYETNGDICAIGRVTFQQLRDYLGGGSLLYTTSSSTVSINGLLISGQGNVGLAGTWRYIYDFVTSYTVNGVTYRDTSSLLDLTFVASRGTIDGFCLDKGAFQQGPREYQISIHRSPPLELWIEDLRDATIVYISSYVMTAEFHGATVPGTTMNDEPTNGQGLLDSILGFLSGSEFDSDEEPNDPSFEESISGAFSSIGLIRYFTKQGVYRTSSMLNGIYEGDDNWAAIEQIQMDTEWDTFRDMVESGWFDGSGNAPPSLDMIVVVRHITANRSSQGCWKQDTAAISVAGPFRAVNDVEDYATRLYDGIRQYGGSITLHFGKRIPRDRSIVRAALQKYARCGVGLNINVPSNECYHPFCERTERYTRFEWPEAYYDV